MKIKFLTFKEMLESDFFTFWIFQNNKTTENCKSHSSYLLEQCRRSKRMWAPVNFSMGKQNCLKKKKVCQSMNAVKEKEKVKKCLNPIVKLNLNVVLDKQLSFIFLLLKWLNVTRSSSLIVSSLTLFTSSFLPFYQLQSSKI